MTEASCAPIVLFPEAQRPSIAAQTGKGADHAWFTCFAPEASPRLVVTVLVEGGGFGAKTAAPVAREMLREAQRLGYFR